MDVPSTLLVTNDFPPRIGGIQRTLEALVKELPPERVTVFAPRSDGWEDFDSAQKYTLVRSATDFLWPTTEVSRQLSRAIAEAGAGVVLFGATYPLALLGPGLARRGTPYLAAAHGFEYWLSIAPGTHSLLRYATSRASRVPVMCSAFIARTVRTAVPSNVPVSVLYPGADLEAFRPDLETADLQARYGLDGRPVVVCVSRLVPRKGQDVLIRGMREVRRRVPEAVLLLVGSGPYRQTLEEMAASESPPGSVILTGQVSEEELPRHYALGHVFAMPCRTRWGGMEVEGWGNVFIEAAACGRPVVVGDSGGAREALIDGETGLLVDGSDVSAVAVAVADLLGDPERAASMGKGGRARVERSHAWPKIAERLAGWLREAAG